MPEHFPSRVHLGPTKVVNAETGLTPHQVSALRGRIVKVVSDNIDRAAAVLDGTESWSAQQVRLFGMLLDKTVPNLSLNANINENRNEDPRRMSREQLEAAAIELMGRQAEEKTRTIKQEMDVTIGGVIEGDCVIPGRLSKRKVKD